MAVLLECTLIIQLLSSPPLDVSADATVRVSPAQRGDDGWLIHRVTSPYQSGTTEIRVLLPKTRTTAKPLNALYILPVEAGNGRRWGDPQLEVKRNDLHNKHQLVCVYPTFSDLPWYADHPSDAAIRQESYFLRVVLPFVEETYTVRREPAGRLLVGFSKSGWGAFSLLLRHPDLFGKAAAWDAPLNMAQPNRFGMESIFATQENFEKYRITTLLRQQAALFRGDQRLVSLGYDNFRDHHLAVENLMNELRISHLFRDGPRRRHAWDTGWLPEAVELLVRTD